MPGLRVTLTQRRIFDSLLAEGASIAEAGREIGVSPATAYRLAHDARSKFREIVCPSCHDTGRLLWRLPQAEDGETGSP